MKFRSDQLSIDPRDPFIHDALERRPLVDFLAGVITKADGPLVIALDSPWGTGKTTLVKMLQASLETKNFRCLYFNAWAVDYATDPLVALVSKMNPLGKAGSPEAKNHLKNLKRIATLVGKRGLIAAIKASTMGALDLDKEIEAALSQGAGDASSDLFDLMTKEGECISRFRDDLEKLVSEIHKEGGHHNLVFFIDELDRCRPSFAIELLERIKHLFDVPNIIFVLSIDKSQLETSTSSIYGVGINAREYLRRFIDLEFRVPQTSGKAFIKNLMARFSLDDIFAARTGVLREDRSVFIDSFAALAKATNISLRTQEHCIARLALVMDQTPSNHFLHPILVATLIVVRSVNSILYAQIRSGTASTEELMNWLGSLEGYLGLHPHSRLAIESYMNAADPDEARRSRRRHRLETVANNSTDDSGERKFATDVLHFTSQLCGSFNGPPSLEYLLKKLDLAENLNP